jgi:hypothetical protein
MISKKFIFCFALLVSSILLTTGCYTVGSMSTEADDAAKSLRPPPDKALVYVLCTKRFGSMVRGAELPVYCDTTFLGTTDCKKYVYALIEPGEHVFVGGAKAAVIYGITANSESELPIVLEAGKTYYIEQQRKTGFWAAKVHLAGLDDAEGRAKLKMCSLSSCLGPEPEKDLPAEPEKDLPAEPEKKTTTKSSDDNF